MTPRTKLRPLPLLLALALGACQTPPARPPAEAHLSKADVAAVDPGIPAPVRQTLDLPRPRSDAQAETYSVVVNNVRLHDLLFALARDAKVNIDIHPNIQGTVTLNAIDQTLPQILDRLAAQNDLRWEVNSGTYVIRPDLAYLETYTVDYVNVSRDTSGTMGIASEVGTTRDGNNLSSTKIVSESTNHFWKTLVQNIENLIREQDKYVTRRKCDQLRNEETAQRSLNKASAQGTGASAASQSAPATLLGALNNLAAVAASGGSAVSGRGDHSSTGTNESERKNQAEASQSCSDLFEAAVVIANPETGTLGVRATKVQHERIQRFLAQVATSARRQVLIEASVVEVQLSDGYQQGINWGAVRGSSASDGIDLVQTGTPVVGSGLLSFVSRSNTSRGTFETAIKLLEQFGTIKVLSSPKISVMNNQTAVLKVVDNIVYFTITTNTQNVNGAVTTQYETTPRVIPIGLVMTVTPQIAQGGDITINVRPSISRIIGTSNDPNPDLAKEGIVSGVPIVRAREMESILKVGDGNTAVLGGLMEDEASNNANAVPWFHRIPVLGALFAQTNRSSRKSELVIFIRPTVVPGSGFGDLARRVGGALPDAEFFADQRSPRYQILPSEQPINGGTRP